MRRLNQAVALASSIWLGGCAQSALDMAPDRSDQPWNPATTPSGEIIPGAKASPGNSGAGYALPSNSEVAAVPLPPQGIDLRKTYTLPELIDIAQTNNPLTRTAWNDARKVALTVGIAESTYLPRITASAAGAYLTSEGNNSTTLAAGPVAVGADTNSNSSARGTISAVSLQWLLFDFGAREAIIEGAKQASVISNIAFTAVHQQVIYDVSVAFYVNAAARAHSSTAAESLRNAQAVEAAVNDRYKNSVGTIIEVSQARQATAQARLVVVQATGAAQNAYLNLISTLGISPLTKLKIADISRRSLSPNMATSVERIISTALARRPDILTAYAAQKASQAIYRASVAEFMPKVFLAGTSAWNSGNLNVTALPSIGQEAPTVNLSGNRSSSSVFLGATIPLYDAGVRAAKVTQAQADVDNADVMLARRQNEAARQIVLADNALRTSLSAYSASGVLSKAAQTTFDAALASYRNGVGSITDLNIASTQLLQARNAQTDAHSTALSAAASLALSTGALGVSPR